jgi:hypothetical protein
MKKNTNTDPRRPLGRNETTMSHCTKESQKGNPMQPPAIYKIALDPCASFFDVVNALNRIQELREEGFTGPIVPLLHAWNALVILRERNRTALAPDQRQKLDDKYSTTARLLEYVLAQTAKVELQEETIAKQRETIARLESEKASLLRQWRVLYFRK